MSRFRRLLVVSAVGLTPVGALAWAGCSDDDNGGGLLAADPGGTHGAEVVLNVSGLGRVVSLTPGIDCPGTCFTKYAFPSATADGAAGQLRLKAEPTSGAKFLGWTFETTPGPAAGRFPECNPITRPATQPPVNASDLEIGLPFGEAVGTAPPGKEASCSGALKVPVLYNITAKFEATLPDTGGGGSGEIVYQPPSGTTGALARRMGMMSGILYFEFTSTTGSGIAFGTNPQNDSAQPAQQLVAPTDTITRIDFDPSGIAYQTSFGSFAIFPGDLSTTALSGGPNCTAMKVDAFGDVYCRAGTALWRWNAGAYDFAPTQLYDSLASGQDFEVTSNATFYTTPSEIRTIPTDLGDAGASSIIVSGQSSPQRLVDDGSNFFWSTLSSGVFTSMRTPSSIAYSTGVPSGTVVQLAVDTSIGGAWVAQTNAIYQVSYSSIVPTDKQPFQSGLSGVGGVAVDTSYVYWSDGDGTVRRAPKSGGGGGL